ncbi:hypothetical protein BLOT_014354 [Blomia tropicalis]|nr:hypothetical protein BLOT_014354 [Blomia tropicalis]
MINSDQLGTRTSIFGHMGICHITLCLVSVLFVVSILFGPLLLFTFGHTTQSRPLKLIGMKEYIPNSKYQK